MAVISLCNWNVSDSFLLLTEEAEHGCRLRTACSVCIDHGGCSTLELPSIQAGTEGCLLSECCFVVLLSLWNNISTLQKDREGVVCVAYGFIKYLMSKESLYKSCCYF